MVNLFDVARASKDIKHIGQAPIIKKVKENKATSIRKTPNLYKALLGK